MRHGDCPHKAGLLESLAAAGPDGCFRLRAHVAGCASCAALMGVVARPATNAMRRSTRPPFVVCNHVVAPATAGAP